jgi:hypothetical protein
LTDLQERLRYGWQLMLEFSRMNFVGCGEKTLRTLKSEEAAICCTSATSKKPLVFNTEAISNKALVPLQAQVSIDTIE